MLVICVAAGKGCACEIRRGGCAYVVKQLREISVKFLGSRCDICC